VSQVPDEVQSKVEPLRLDIPTLPYPYVARHQLNRIVGRILVGTSKRRGESCMLTSERGYGKSVLAAALARSEVFMRRFPNGIFWIDCSTNENAIESINNALLKLDPSLSPANSVSKCLVQFGKLVPQGDSLVIFDGLEELVFEKSILDFARSRRVLITTCKQKETRALGTRVLQLKPFTTYQGVGLLQRVMEIDAEDSEFPLLFSIVRACGRIPSVIATVGQLLHRRPMSRITAWLQKYESGSGEPFDFARGCLLESLADFTKDEQKLFERLLTFEVGTAIPESAVQTLWYSEIDQHQAMVLIDRFIDAGLLYRVDDLRVGINRLQHLASKNSASLPLKFTLPDAYLARFRDWRSVPFDGYFEHRILKHLKAAGRVVDATKVAQVLLSAPIDCPPATAAECIELLGDDAEPYATELLRVSDNALVQFRCLHLLGRKASEHARRIVHKATNENVIALCIHILGDSAKHVAAKFIKPHVNPTLLCVSMKVVGNRNQQRILKVLDSSTNSSVIEMCLKQLRDPERSERAAQFLRAQDHGDEVNPQVLVACLKICGEKQRAIAERLLKTHTDRFVRTTCLRIVGKRDKRVSRSLLSLSESDDVLCRCIDGLGDEAKEFAKIIVRSNRGFQLTTKCLRLLGREGKPDAEFLLENSDDPRVLMCALRVLGKRNAKPYARMILNRVLAGELDDLVASRCFKILGEDSADAAATLIKRTTKTEVQIAAIELLKHDAKADARRILSGTDNQIVAYKCLELLRGEAVDDAYKWLAKAGDKRLVDFCREIIAEGLHEKSEADSVVSTVTDASGE